MAVITRTPDKKNRCTRPPRQWRSGTMVTNTTHGSNVAAEIVSMLSVKILYARRFCELIAARHNHSTMVFVVRISMYITTCSSVAMPAKPIQKLRRDSREDRSATVGSPDPNGSWSRSGSKASGVSNAFKMFSSPS